MTHEFYNILLISPQELKEESLINANVEEKVLNSIVQTSQEIYLCKIIGTALYRRLQELVYNEIHNETPKISDQEYTVYNELLENYVKPYLKYSAMKAFLIENTYKMRNIGVTRMNDTNVMSSDLDTLKYLEKHYDVYRSEFEDRLSKFICANKDSLPEVTAEVLPYLEEPQMGDTFAPTSGLWLGGTKNKGCGSCRK